MAQQNDKQVALKTPDTVPVTKSAFAVDDGAINAIVSGDHGDPFAVLGLHETGKIFVARAFVHAAEP